jgi:hypothetical protein
MNIEIKVFPSASHCRFHNESILGEGCAKTCIMLNNNKNVMKHQFLSSSKLEEKLFNVSLKYNLRDVYGRIGSNVFVTKENQFKIIDYGIPTRW